jgi:GNAT superfamily N-acetyltransferase
VELRPTTADDLPAMLDVFTSAIGSVYEPHRFAPPMPPPDSFYAQHRHLLRTDPHRCLVAVRGGSVLGYVAAFQRGSDWFLASLFVSPAAQASGVGSRLLAAAWGDDAVRRRTLTDAIQPISNALYGRRGLVPTTPLLSFSGAPPAGAAPSLPVGEPPADLSSIDERAYGFDRAVDHGFWGGIAERTVWLRDGCPAAYSYRFPEGPVGPVGGVDPAAAAAALRGELARGGTVTVRIPGSSRALVECALAAGLRLAPTPGLLLLSEGVPAPDALAIASYTLY